VSACLASESDARQPDTRRVLIISSENLNGHAYLLGRERVSNLAGFAAQRRCITVASLYNRVASVDNRVEDCPDDNLKVVAEVID